MSSIGRRVCPHVEIGDRSGVPLRARRLARTARWRLRRFGGARKRLLASSGDDPPAPVSTLRRIASMLVILKLFSTLPKTVKDSARAAEPPVPRIRAKDKSRGSAAETDRCALGQCRSQSATEAAAGHDRAPRSGGARGLLKIYENIFFWIRLISRPCEQTKIWRGPIDPAPPAIPRYPAISLAPPGPNCRRSKAYSGRRRDRSQE